MSQQVRRRHQKNIQYEANNKMSESLGRGMVYRELYLRLTGKVDDPTNAAATIGIGDEWACVKRIEIIANNTDVLRSLSGNQLWRLDKCLYGICPPITPAIGAGSADPAFDSCLCLPFWMPKSVRPIDTALDARELSDLKIEVTWGDHLDVSSTATGWITEPVIEVHSLESFNVKGPFSQWRVYNIQKEITADNPQFQVILPVGPMYRAFLFNTVDGGKEADDILNNVKIKSGTTIFADVPAELLRQIDTGFKCGVLTPYDSGAGNYDTLRRGTTYNNDCSWYYYDHVTDGFLTECIDTLGYSEFELELDVSVGAGTTYINIMPLQIIPIRG